jgi:hypothetical protein
MLGGVPAAAHRRPCGKQASQEIREFREIVLYCRDTLADLSVQIGIAGENRVFLLTPELLGIFRQRNPARLFRWSRNNAFCRQYD